jgi:diguanylate cyclase (GGDEF)-like protein
MPVDAPTLLIAITIVHLSGALLFLFVWRLFANRFEANITGIGIWSLTLFLFGSGNVLVGLRTLIPDWTSIVLGNAFLLFGIGLARLAISVFFDQKRHLVLAGLPVVVWLALCAYPPFLDNTLARIVTVQFAVSGSLLWMTWLFFTKNSENLYTARMTGVVTFTLAAAGIYYCVSAIPSGHTDLPNIFQQEFAKTYLLVALLCTVSAVILIFAMIIEKEQLYFRTQARQDPLTGLSNRRAFREMLQGWMKEQDCAGVPFTIAIFDIDQFKATNDKYGHVLGDAILQLLARICDDSADNDRVFASHLGGDGFAVFYGGIPIGKAALLAEQIRQKFARASESATEGRLRSTLSAGLSGGDLGETDIQDALRAADLALANAKRRGRNRLTMSMVTVENPASDNEADKPQAACEPEQDMSRPSKKVA